MVDNSILPELHNYLVYIVGAVNRMGSLTRWTYFHNGPTVPFNFFYLIHL
jgi:hypothetical protein